MQCQRRSIIQLQVAIFHQKCLNLALYSTTLSSSSSSNHLDPEYQFMQRSKLPTMYFQPSLPRLPIPQLDKTCERYLNALRPLLIDESYRKTKDIVQRFQMGSGQQLQKLLKEHDKANKHTSYISEPWFDMYLRDRVPLPINYNPLMMMKHDQRNEYNDQLIRSTNLIISSLRFMRSLRADYLEPEVYHLNPEKSDTEQFRLIMKLIPRAIATYVAYTFKAYPLDMSQYNGLFGATRIPELDKDRIYCNDKSKHIIVIRKGNFYAVDVLDDLGNIEPPKVILNRMKQILNQNTLNQPEHPLGVLSTLNRNTWAKLRHHLYEIGNENALKILDSGLFCICLDDGATFNKSNPIPLVREFLAGDGINRWFDKSFSIFVAKDGTAAINFEHSWGDGVAVLRFINEIYNETTKRPFVDLSMKSEENNIAANVGGASDNPIRMIEFKLDDRMKEGIKDARIAHNAVMDSLDLNFIRYTDINKIFCKTNRVSPDAIMQLSFQLAFRQQYGQYVGTYESASTAAFRHGRTETMRPCTMATKEFCDAIVKTTTTSSSSKDSSINSKQLRSMIERCSTIHGQLTREAAMGQGFDRHLFGLRHTAIKNELKIPSLFEDASYQLINYNIISTSTLSSPGMLGGGFGPVVKDGFGIGYIIQNDECGCMVSSYKGKRNGGEFIQSLHKAFNIIRDVLNKNK